ncbi:MAG: sugar ABC transporter permease [Firmicutes bacterium]|nr:sugar ABC transporter permease [Bacillota bacterium]
MSRLARKEEAWFFIFVGPWLVGFLWFTLGPMLTSIWISLTRWDILSPPEYIGLANYSKLLTADPTFTKALANTLYMVVFNVPIHTVGVLAVSMLLAADLRGIKTLRTIYYLPAILSGVAVAVLWQWLLMPRVGLIDFLLGKIGLVGPQWLYDPRWSKPGLILMGLWSVGGGMPIYLAAIKGIPSELYEAAQIDGAGLIGRFRKITVPMLSPVLFFSVVTGTIGTLQIFVQSLIMVDPIGGPQESTMFLMLQLYMNAFLYYKWGYASAIAWIIFVIAMALTLLNFVGAKRWVYYEGEVLRG